LFDAGLARLAQLVDFNIEFLDDPILAASLRYRQFHLLQIGVVAHVLSHLSLAGRTAPFLKFDEVQVSLGGRF
jgi:hypothetical protein